MKKKVTTSTTLKTKAQGAAKLMPLHKRIATGNKPIKKP